MNLQDLLIEGIIVKIVPTEKPRYLRFFEYTYKDNLNHANYNLIKYPRWSIISSYYAMHDLTKLFLAKEFDLKISEKRVHTATIIALRDAMKNEDLKKRLIELLEKAEIVYRRASLASILSMARDERENVQYYTGKDAEKEIINFKAAEFLEKVVSPFIKIMEGLI